MEGLPFVSIDRCLGPDVPCVASDNYAGGRLAAEKLPELGCTHLAFLRVGSPNLSETDKRGDGFDGIRRFETEALYCSTIIQPTVDLLLSKDRSNIPSLVCLPVSYAPGGTTRE